MYSVHDSITLRDEIVLFSIRWPCDGTCIYNGHSSRMIPLLGNLSRQVPGGTAHNGSQQAHVSTALRDYDASRCIFEDCSSSRLNFIIP